MTTEADAKKKWCPFVRTGLTAGMAVNHHVGLRNGPHAGDVHEETRCIGSGCMMWSVSFMDQGYCGLAGLPPAAARRTSERYA